MKQEKSAIGQPPATFIQQEADLATQGTTVLEEPKKLLAQVVLTPSTQQVAYLHAQKRQQVTGNLPRITPPQCALKATTRTAKVKVRPKVALYAQ